MIKEPNHEKLTYFLTKSYEDNFAKITYECGAIDLVKDNLEFDHSTGKMCKTYKFKKSVLTNIENIGWKYGFFVLYLENYSYILYEVYDEKITVWVCFTKNKERDNGYMTILLKKLVLLYPDIQIIVDTFNETLKNICKKQNIKLFRN